MKQSRTPRDNDFEQRLLDELKAVVGERGAQQASAVEGARPTPAWRRAPRLALGAIAVLAVAAAVLVFNSGGDNPPKAFAVEPQRSGGVTIKIYSLEDAAGLERALKKAGIRSQVTWLPAGMSCREPHFTPSRVKTSMGGSIGAMTMGGSAPAMTIGAMSPRQYREHWREYRRGEISADEYRASTPSISLDPAEFRPDQSVILSGSPAPYGGDPEGGYEAHLAIAEGPVQPCEPSEGLVHPSPAKAGAGVAHASGAPAEAPPAAGQYLYTKTKVVQLQGWDADGPGAGPKAKPRHFTANLLGPEANALPALVPAVRETWTSPSGRMRVRETLGRIEFLSGDDQSRWEAAGSPPPFAFDPREHHVGRDESGRPVKEFDSRYWRGSHVFANVAELAKAPTDPEALRLSIEHRRGGGAVTIERLMEILGEPIVSPALRAAAINALAEIPGIELEHGVTDVAGRRGDALVREGEKGSGFGREIIFAPKTAKILAEAEMVLGPRSTREYRVPANTVFRETAYLRSGVVDSKHETSAAAR